MRVGEHAPAEALRLAVNYLEKMGWRYTPEKLGETAGRILTELAQAMETREGRDAKTGSIEDESRVGKADAPKSPNQWELYT